MNGRRWRHATYAAFTAMLLTGCGSLAPSANSTAPQRAQVDARTGSWMLLDAKKDALLYISTAGGYVYVYSYPANTLVGQLSGFISPEGLCSDKAGHIFVTDSYLQEVSEFAHGDTQPIAMFTQSSQDWHPISCSVDPGTKNLAVQPDGTHSLYIFKHEGSGATIYNNPYGYGYLGGTYDGSGNFFMRGTPNHIAELPKGTSTFTNIKLSRHIDPTEGFAWDGKYLSITNGNTSAIIDYRIHVHRTVGTVVSASSLKGAELVRQFTIYKSRFIGPDQFASQVTFWKYPRFGNAIGAITGLTEPIGSALSVGR